MFGLNVYMAKKQDERAHIERLHESYRDKLEELKSLSKTQACHQLLKKVDLAFD